MGKRKTAFTAVISATIALLLIMALLIISIEMFALNEQFFDRSYQELGTAEHIGISEQGLYRVTQKLLDYTRGEDENLDIREEIRGEQREVFGQREKDHMVDVKHLYLAARDVRTAALIGVIVFVVLLFLLARVKALPMLCKAFLTVSAFFLAAVMTAGLWAAVDFSSFWTAFHHVFFTNDLWILDPRTDVLIMMVPQQFFSNLVARIIIRFASMFLALNAAAAAGLYYYKQRLKKKQN